MTYINKQGVFMAALDNMSQNPPQDDPKYLLVFTCGCTNSGLSENTPAVDKSDDVVRAHEAHIETGSPAIAWHDSCVYLIENSLALALLKRDGDKPQSFTLVSNSFKMIKSGLPWFSSRLVRLTVRR